VIGGVVGIVFVSRGIEVVLRRYPTKFYYFIIGLLIASVWKLYPGLPSGTLVIVSALTLVVGAVIARSLAE
jgi:putative membrane protein